jgi:hypothetical protein
MQNQERLKRERSRIEIIENDFELKIAELEAEVDRLRRYRNWYVAGELRLRRVKR